MKIAVPSTDDRGLESEVSSHFGRAPFYTIVTAYDGEIKEVEVIRNPFTEHSPGDLPNLLRERGVDVILAHGIGRRARTFFSSMKIDVITGVQGRVKEVIKSCLEGTLSSDESWMDLAEFKRRHRCSSRKEFS